MVGINESLHSSVNGSTMVCPTNLNNTDKEDPIEQFSQLGKYIIPLIYGVITVVGLVGNILVIVTVFLNKAMQQLTGILILNLAIADLLLLVFCIPFSAIYSIMEWPFGIAWCKINTYLIYTSAGASVYTLVFMSLYRYLAVVHPIRSIKFRNKRNVKIIVFFTWVIALGVNVPILFQWRLIEYCYKAELRLRCNPLHNPNFDQTGQRLFLLSFFTLGYMIPLAVISVLYGILIKRLRYDVVPVGNQTPSKIKSMKTVTRNVFIVVVVFALCWLPLQIVVLDQNFGTLDQSVIGLAIGAASGCIAFINSCINPILYAFLSKKFRTSFMKLSSCHIKN